MHGYLNILQSRVDCDFCFLRDCLLRRKCMNFFVIFSCYFFLGYAALHAQSSVIPLGMSTQGELMWLCRALRCPGICGVVGLQGSRSISFLQHDAEAACCNFRNLIPNYRSLQVANLSQAIFCSLPFQVIMGQRNRSS